MNYADATQFCRSLGEGSRLPSVEEWRALARVMSPDGRFNPESLPDINGHNFFCVSSLFPFSDPNSHCFCGNYGNFVSADKNSRYWVRAVRFAFLQDIQTAQMSGTLIPVQAPQQVRNRLASCVISCLCCPVAYIMCYCCNGNDLLDLFNDDRDSD